MVRTARLFCLLLICLVFSGCAAHVDTVRVVIPAWEDPAGNQPQQDCYAEMRPYFREETGKRLSVKHLPLSRLEESDASLLHMVGTDAVEVSSAERDAIQSYLDSGGTILIENLGGAGGFAQSIRIQLGSIFPGDSNRVEKRSDIITGRNLPEGSKNNRRLLYRRMVLERANPEARLMLFGYSKNERYPVLLSYEDLSQGMLGIEDPSINGYAIETARNLMLNILLEADKALAAQQTD